MNGVVTTLPPQDTSPASARRAIAEALVSAGLEVMLDDALLLVTELVTNAVVHAGTDIELHVEIGVDSARVEVIDRSAGSLPVLQGEPDAAREGGRGIFLLDALAQEWGTRHFPGGKSVWFALGLVDRMIPRPLPLRVPSDTRPTTRPDMTWLLGLPADLEERLSSTELLGELLHRLCGAMDLRDGWLLAEPYFEGEQWTVVASHDPSAPPPDVDSVRRLARDGTDQVLAGQDERLILPLRRRTGVFGALVLSGSDYLAESDVALARLVGDRMGVVMRDDRAHAMQLRDRGSLALLAEASEMFAGTLDVTLAVTLAAQLVVPRFASWSGVYTTGEEGPRLAAVAHENESALSALRSALSDADAQALADRLVQELGEQPTLLSPKEVPPGLSSTSTGDVLAVPLVARRRLLGVLLAGRQAGASYARDDAGLLLDLARRAALAVDNARLYEERTLIAQALQASLLPPDLPSVAEASFGARYAAAGAGNDVGGDFYDVFALPGGDWAVAIGDVCGKGAEAAAITGLARNVMRLLAREGRSPTAVLRRLNSAILELGDRSRFCTANLATVSCRPDGLLLHLSSAGHPPPVLIAEDGSASFVGTSGDLLGVLDDVTIADDEVVLRPGEALVFYTDGVTERRDGSVMFGEYNLLGACRTAAGGTADEIAGQLEEAVRAFSPEASRDDLAVLVVRAAPRL
jgi:serine phosphatase RsbU (regulator of sigma subunit)/anti-sigma regulatory factor (Ser/Thr protein kinase)